MARPWHRNDVEESSPEAARARAFWSGTISFGLVSVPVALFPGTKEQRATLRMLSPDGTPLERRWHCPEEDKDVPWSQLVRGYETEKGEYVVMTDEEIESAAPEKSRDIDLRRFVPRASLDPVFFERGYFLVPAGETAKAYRLLVEAMEKTGLAGIATFVMRTREYLIAILAEDGLLRAETLRWAGEIRSPQAVGLGKTPPKPDAADVKKIEKAIRAHTTRSLSEKELEDPARPRLEKLVKAKLRKHEDVVELPEEVDAEPEAEGIIDLMAVLKRSLEAERAGGGRKTPARKHARKTKPAASARKGSKKPARASKSHRPSTRSRKAS
jgi:DNA end-binding protein Ku